MALLQNVILCAELATRTSKVYILSWTMIAYVIVNEITERYLED